ncbi:MAG: ribose 5-phosphate isomerase A [Thermoplasmata archaeon]
MMIEKRNAGRDAAEYIEDGQVVGLGTGSTTKYAIERLGERVKEEGLDIIGIPTSKATEHLAKGVGIPLTNLDENPRIDITIDGADEVDPELNLIKGGGGALLREKIIAYQSNKVIIVVDPSKQVKKLGLSFPLPVEVVPFSASATVRNVEELGCTANIRMDNGTIFKTDNGNYILDCDFEGIDDLDDCSIGLNSVPGVVENGLFIDIADIVVVGKEDSVEEFSL